MLSTGWGQKERSAPLTENISVSANQRQLKAAAAERPAPRLPCADLPKAARFSVKKLRFARRSCKGKGGQSAEEGGCK